MVHTQAELQDLANKIAAAKAQIPALEAAINKARMGGIDVSDQQARMTTLKDTIRKLELQYGTGT